MSVAGRAEHLSITGGIATAHTVNRMSRLDKLIVVVTYLSPGNNRKPLVHLLSTVVLYILMASCKPV